MRTGVSCSLFVVFLLSRSKAKYFAAKAALNRIL